MRYDLILFDADETLFDFPKSERVALQRAMEEHGIAYEEDTHLPMYRAINQAMWAELELGRITQKELKVERFRRFLDCLGRATDPKVFGWSFMKALGQASFPYPDAEPLIRALHGKAQLRIITNGLAAVQRERIGKSPLIAYFDRLIISEEIGISKPEPGIFDVALADSKVPKERVLIVGDSLTSDMKGGANYGIDTCWYNPTGKVNAGVVEPTYEVRSLVEVLGIVGAAE